MRQVKITQSITMHNKTLDAYLRDIGDIRLITAEEEVQLAYLIKSGDRIALQKLSNANLRFVVSVAKQYQNQGLFLEDLISEGNLGLMKAAQRFDASKGFKFISYAVWWIRQSIIAAIADQARIVRLPLNKIGQKNKLTKASVKFLQEEEREPSPEELAEITEMSLDAVFDSIDDSRYTLSLDSPIYIESSSPDTLIDTVPNKELAPDSGFGNDDMRVMVEQFLSRVSEKQQTILKMFFGIGMPAMSLAAIGVQVGFTAERVRQIKDGTLRKLGAIAKEKKLTY